jgi:hypothetical protein
MHQSYASKPFPAVTDPWEYGNNLRPPQPAKWTSSSPSIQRTARPVLPLLAFRPSRSMLCSMQAQIPFVPTSDTQRTSPKFISTNQTNNPPVEMGSIYNPLLAIVRAKTSLTPHNTCPAFFDIYPARYSSSWILVRKSTNVQAVPCPICAQAVGGESFCEESEQRDVGGPVQSRS